jgi:alpha-amylase
MPALRQSGIAGLWGKNIKKTKPYEEAQRELFRGQCNCAYWHGVFGGLYLPHLRFAIYQRLIRADSIIDQALQGKKWRVARHQEDFDMDGAPEFRLSNPQVVLYIKPDRGGHLIEFDGRDLGVNLLNALTRRPEAYHAKLLAAVSASHGEGVKSIHDITAVKSADLDKKLNYDWYRRESLIDHFYAPSTSLEDAARGARVDAGDFVEGAYQAESSVTKSEVSLTLKRSGVVAGPAGQTQVEVVKTVRLGGTENGPQIEYTVRNLGNTFLETVFGVEFNVAMLAGSDPSRYYRLASEPRAGLLADTKVFDGQRELAVVDESLGLEVTLAWSEAAQVWAYPIETVSQSESGFELVFQSAAVTPRWLLKLQPGEPWRVTLGHEIRSRG